MAESNEGSREKALRGVFFAPNAPTGYVGFFIRNTPGEVIRMGQIRDTLWDDAFHRELFDWLDAHDSTSDAAAAGPTLRLVRDETPSS